MSDSSVCTALGVGGAYAHVSAAYIQALPDAVREEVVEAYTSAMKNVWEVCMAFCAVGLEENIPMRMTAAKGDAVLKGKKKGESAGADSAETAGDSEEKDAEAGRVEETNPAASSSERSGDDVVKKDEGREVSEA